MREQVSFQWKNPDFLFKNPDFLLKNVDFVTKTRLVYILTPINCTEDQCRKGGASQIHCRNGKSACIPRK